MKNTFLTLLTLVYSICTLEAQKATENFSLFSPPSKFDTSFYTQLKILDTRADTTNYGIIQKGLLNKKAFVIPTISLEKQIQNLIDTRVDTTLKDGKLLLHIRRLNFSEITKSFTEEGYCYFRAGLYEIILDRYSPIASIDTLILIKYGSDVTSDLLEFGGNALVHFVMKNLASEPDLKKSVDINHLLNIDSIEKMALPAFSNPYWKNGLYNDFNSFKNQTPNRTDEIELKQNFDHELIGIKMKNEQGKFEKIKGRDIYAFVKDSVAYISTEFGYEKLTKDKLDIKFTGRHRLTANTGDVVTASLLFGVLGGVLASNNSEFFELKIDHVNGGFIPIREIE